MTQRIVAAFVMMLVATQSVLACCTLGPPGVVVNIADQEILVVWDQESGIEHFVRRATFKTDAPDFGFLVPTPSTPELGEEDDHIFDQLANLTKPEIKVETRYGVGAPSLLMEFLWARMGARVDSMAISNRAGGVNVLHRQRVAGYDAVVLEADDAGALATWLQDNEYSTRPQLAEWLTPYVDARWKVTAFRHVAEGTADAVSTKAVRMTFATDRPLFPYRVPTDQLSKVTGGGLLRTFYVGEGRVEGILGAEANPWSGTTLFSAPRDSLPTVLGDMAPSLSGGRPWLTVFEDETWPGGTEDLFFIPAADTTPIVPPPIIRYNDVRIPIPSELLLLAGFLWWRRARAKKKTS